MPPRFTDCHFLYSLCRIPNVTEIALVPLKDPSSPSGQFPGLYLFTGPARMVRPVINQKLNAIELIGTFEQVYLDICVSAEEDEEKVATHQEIRQTAFLSNLACTIPLPDFNQVCRRVFQPPPLRYHYFIAPLFFSLRATCTNVRWASRPWPRPRTLGGSTRRPRCTGCRRPPHHFSDLLIMTTSSEPFTTLENVELHVSPRTSLFTNVHIMLLIVPLESCSIMTLEHLMNFQHGRVPDGHQRGGRRHLLHRIRHGGQP